MKIRDMKVGDNNLDLHVLVTDCRIRQTVNQTPYYGLVISDGDDSADARIWTTNIAQNLKEGEIKIGNVYRVTAKVQDYAGKLQIIITSIQEPDDSVDSQSFYRQAPLDGTNLRNGIKKYLDQIKSINYKLLVNELLSENFDKFMSFPAAVTMHHNYIGGLAYHTFSMCRLSDAYIVNYPEIDKDLLLSGILIHDIGKIVEMSDAKLPTYSDKGHLLGHIVIGLQMLAVAASKHHLLDSKEYMTLAHLLASHHGELEYGSPKEPLMLEAYALYLLDFTDSKLTGISEEVKKTAPGAMTQPIPTIGKKMFYVE